MRADISSSLSSKLHSDQCRGGKLATPFSRPSGKKAKNFLPAAATPSPANQTNAHTQSVSKHNFTHKPTSSNSQAPSCAFKHSGGSIDFQEGRNTQVEPLRLQPSKSALFLATHEEPCWAQSQEPNTEESSVPIKRKLLTQSNSALWQEPLLFPNVGIFTAHQRCLGEGLEWTVGDLQIWGIQINFNWISIFNLTHGKCIIQTWVHFNPNYCFALRFIPAFTFTCHWNPSLSNISDLIQ